MFLSHCMHSGRFQIVMEAPEDDLALAALNGQGTGKLQKSSTNFGEERRRLALDSRQRHHSSTDGESVFMATSAWHLIANRVYKSDSLSRGLACSLTFMFSARAYSIFYALLFLFQFALLIYGIVQFVALEDLTYARACSFQWR